MKPAHVLIAGGSLLSLGAIVASLAKKASSAQVSPHATPALPPNVLVLVEPFIDTNVASSLLYALDQRRAPQFLILHTRGGLAVACAQLAEAILETETTVVVPYMAYSGGTLIALSARRLLMGEYAALTPVDPMIDDHRAIHNEDYGQKELQRVAEEYLVSMSGLVDRIVARRVADKSKRAGARAMLLGANSPHGWPVMRSTVAELGFGVEACGPEWGRMVCLFHNGGECDE